MHAMRAYYQTVVWETLGFTCLKPTDWGWKLEGNSLIPIQMLCDVAPEHMMQVVRCKCAGKCSSTLCSCRKHGLQCVSACKNCHGTDCTNAHVDMTDIDDSHEAVDSTAPFDNGLPDVINDHDFFVLLQRRRSVAVIRTNLNYSLIFVL
jgi:hypothetical protein